jgi:hypothetical protein
MVRSPERRFVELAASGRAPVADPPRDAESPELLPSRWAARSPEDAASAEAVSEELV